MTSNLSFSSTEVLWGIGIGLFIIAAIIFFGRRYFMRLSESNLTEKYRGKKWDSPLTARNKYPDVNIFGYRDTILRFSLVATLGLVIGLFNLTTEEKKALVPDGAAMLLTSDIEVDLPRTQELPPPPPPPPPPIIQEVPNDVLADVEDVDFVDQSVDANTSVVNVPVAEHKEERKYVAPPPPPPVEVEEEIFKIVEEAPRFPGCDDLPTIQEKTVCANKKLLEFIYKNIEYPGVARENGIEGTAVIRFVVDKDGTVKDIQIIREIGGGCGEEAVRVVKLMNEMPAKWSPGKQRGRPVKVYFTLPVKFLLKVDP